MTARYTLYGLRGSVPSYKVALMLALCGEPFDYVHVNLREGEHKTPAYLARNRFGQVPCLVDNANGRQLAQSAAILEYLADKTGRFGGATLDERLAAREWLFWEFDRLTRGINRPRGVRAGYWQLPDDVVAHYEAEGRAALGVLEQHLAGRSFIVGDQPTIADIDIYAVVRHAPQAGIDLAGYPNVASWLARIEQLPGFGAPEAVLPAASQPAAGAGA